MSVVLQRHHWGAARLTSTVPGGRNVMGRHGAGTGAQDSTWRSVQTLAIRRRIVRARRAAETRSHSCVSRADWLRELKQKILRRSPRPHHRPSRLHCMNSACSTGPASTASNVARPRGRGVHSSSDASKPNHGGQSGIILRVWPARGQFHSLQWFGFLCAKPNHLDSLRTSRQKKH